MYNFELEKVSEEINKRNAKKVLLQLPDGFRSFAYKIVKILKENTNSNFILSGDSCYGGCDLAIRQAEELDVDLLVHYGHSRYLKTKIPVMYIHAEIDINIKAMIPEILPFLTEWKRVGIVSTIQHLHQLDEVKEELEKNGYNAVIGENTEHIHSGGQILGCYYKTAINISKIVDGWLYIGGGQFHPKGLILSTGIPVLIANPYNGNITKLTPKDLMQLAKKRIAGITLAKKANTIAILISSKPGQKNTNVAEELYQKFSERNIDTMIIYLDEVRSDHLNNFTEPEVFINTACPRIAIDGISGINRPILTIAEAKVVLDEIKWEEIWGNKYLEPEINQ